MTVTVGMPLLAVGVVVFGYLASFLHSRSISPNSHWSGLAPGQVTLILVFTAGVFLSFLLSMRKNYLHVLVFFEKSQKTKDIQEDQELDTLLPDEAQIEIPPDKSEKSEKSVQKKKAEELSPASATLKIVTNMGAILMCYMFTAATHWASGGKVYDRDFFIGIHLLFLLASLMTLKKSSEPGVILSRDQTEEWKGWMQIIFLAYHYYDAKEVYNLVRVLIAAYVWMTGFGHFIYFRTRKTYDFPRVFRTLVRLNFLIILVCLATDNPYMLYYICAMHTFWFLFVFVVMYIGKSHNHKTEVIWAKLILSFVLITILFENEMLFKTVFWPLRFLLEKNGDGLHEWWFRLGLDHYAAWFGMVSGFALPSLQASMNRLDTQPVFYQWTRKGPISLVLLLVTWFWYKRVYLLSKFQYNAVHPYTFWVPLVTWLWFRNCTLTLRSFHLEMFAVWGKITLESYISQLHLLLTDNAAKLLLVWPDYRMLTSIIVSIFFGICSKVLFNMTVLTNLTLAPEGITTPNLVYRLLMVLNVSALLYSLGAVTQIVTA